MTRLVLASASPRRQALLAAVGRSPDEVVPADVDERALAGETAAGLVRRLARRKREVVLGSGASGAVLAADTVVALAGTVVGKPTDDEDARSMLRSLAGEVATVWSGVAVGGAVPEADVAVGTFLRFRPFDDATIDDYVATGEPSDAAGAFRLQGRGAALVAASSGCTTNVVGLPLCQATRLLARRDGRDPDEEAVSCARCALVTSLLSEHPET